MAMIISVSVPGALESELNRRRRDRLALDDFRESEHKRDDGGKFSSTGGGSSGGGSEGLSPEAVAWLKEHPRPESKGSAKIPPELSFKAESGEPRTLHRGVWGPDKAHGLSGGVETFTDSEEVAHKYATEPNDPELAKEYEAAGNKMEPRVVDVKIDSKKPFALSDKGTKTSIGWLKRQLDLTPKEVSDLAEATKHDWRSEGGKKGFDLYYDVKEGKAPDAVAENFDIVDSPVFHAILKKRGYDAVSSKSAMVGKEGGVGEFRALDPSIVKRTGARAVTR